MAFRPEVIDTHCDTTTHPVRRRDPGSDPRTRDRIHHEKEAHDDSFPPLQHVALTVRDLSVSVPWYEALLDADPVIDEDTDPDMHHTVYLLGGGTLLGLHQHQTPAPAEPVQ